MNRAGAELPERERALDIIGRIYDAVSRPAAFRTVTAEIVQLIGATKGVLFSPATSPQPGGFSFPCGLPEAFIEQWERLVQSGALNDAGTARANRDNTALVFNSPLPAQVAVYEWKTCRHLLEPLGIAGVCTSVVLNASELAAPIFLSVFRAASEPPFGQSHRERMAILIPHLSRAFVALLRLQHSDFLRVAAHGALEQVGSGIVLLNEHGQVIFSNRGARRIFARRDGLVLRSSDPATKSAEVVADDWRITKAIHECVGGCLTSSDPDRASSARVISAPRHGGQRPYLLQVFPLPLPSVSGGPVGAHVMMILQDADIAPALDPALLNRLFHLTPAETRLAAVLWCGEPIKAAADICGISESTARSHLRQILKKTGSSRQAELMRVFACLTVMES